MRVGRSVLVVLIVGGIAVVGGGIVLSPPAARLPGPVVVGTAPTGRPPGAANQTREPTVIRLSPGQPIGTQEGREPLEVVVPRRSVSSLALVGDHSKESTKRSTSDSELPPSRPVTTTSTPDATAANSKSDKTPSNTPKTSSGADR
ncbi:MAG: hypothetical protein ACYDEY_04095 [Acidimicrobiales bacterium]